MKSTLRFKTNIKNQNSASKLVLHLQQIIADFVIQFECEQSDYIFILKGNREVSSLLEKALIRQGIDYSLLNPRKELII